MNGGNNFSCTPAGAITLTFTNITNGQSGYILMINSGGQTISLASTSKGDANLAGTISTAGTYLISYLANGTNAYLTTSSVFV
jgi:cell division ATPase FtsA